MAKAKTKECPKCGIIATGIKKVRELFGFRVYRDQKYIQSYCKDCKADNKLNKKKINKRKVGKK